MMQLFKTSVGRLRILGFLEGISLLILVFIAVPLKYYGGNPLGSQILGPIHGGLFLLFLFNALAVGIAQKWKFSTAGQVLLASFVPFGTFYIDHKILRRLPQVSE